MYFKCIRNTVTRIRVPFSAATPSTYSVDSRLRRRPTTTCGRSISTRNGGRVRPRAARIRRLKRRPLYLREIPLESSSCSADTRTRILTRLVSMWTFSTSFMSTRCGRPLGRPMYLLKRRPNSLDIRLVLYEITWFFSAGVIVLSEISPIRSTA